MFFWVNHFGYASERSPMHPDAGEPGMYADIVPVGFFYVGF